MDKEMRKILKQRDHGDYVDNLQEIKQIVIDV